MLSRGLVARSEAIEQAAVKRVYLSHFHMSYRRCWLSVALPGSSNRRASSALCHQPVAYQPDEHRVEEWCGR